MKFITSKTILVIVPFVALTEGKSLRVGRSVQEEKHIVCSGNGNRYEIEEHDQLAFFGLSPTCSCFDCYYGDNCEFMKEMNDCHAEADGVDLGLTKEVIVAPNLLITSSYRMDYEGWKTITGGNKDKQMDFLLHQTLTDLHKAVGNANTDGHTLVVGLGSHQLIQAANHAVSKNIYKGGAGETSSVYGQVPYWSKFPRMVNEFAPRTEWIDDSASAEAAEETESLIEMIVSPSNPGNLLASEQAPLLAPKERQIWDLVYYWPSSYADAKALTPLDEDIMIFSLSKLAGYAAHRFGWAWVKDPDIAAEMANYVSVSTQAYPANEMLFGINILQSILKSVGTKNDFFKLVQDELMSRCRQIEEVFEDGGGKFRIATPCGNMYMLVECDGECAPYFEEIGLDVSPGASMGFTGVEATNNVRLCYGYESSRFDVIIKKLKLLPKKSGGDDDDQ